MGPALSRRHRSVPCRRSARIRSVDDVLRALTDPEAALALSGWIYLLLAVAVAVAVAVDSIIPILPAEVLCIGAGAPAASGDVHAGLAVGVVATGRWSATPAPTNSGAPTPTAPCVPCAPTQAVDVASSASSAGSARAAARHRPWPLRARRADVRRCPCAASPANTAASAAGMALWAVYVVGLGYAVGGFRRQPTRRRACARQRQHLRALRRRTLRRPRRGIPP